MALFLEGKRTASLVTEVDSAIYRVRKQDLTEFHEEHPDAFLRIASTLSVRLQAIVQQLRTLDVTNTADMRHSARSRRGKDELKGLFENLKRLQNETGSHELELLLNLYRSQN